MHQVMCESTERADCRGNINTVTVKVERGSHPGSVPRAGAAVYNEFNHIHTNTALLPNANFGQIVTPPGFKQKYSNTSSRGSQPRLMTMPCTCMNERTCCETCAVSSTASSFDLDSTGPVTDSSCCTNADDVAEIPGRSSNRENITGSSPSLPHGYQIHLAPDFKDQVSQVASLPDVTLSSRTPPSSHHTVPDCHQSQFSRNRVQMKPSYSCTSLPVIEGGMDEACRQQVAMVQQQAIPHDPMSPSSGWTLTAAEQASFGGPIASSTPTAKTGSRFVQQCSLAVHPSSWHGQSKEQLQWMSNTPSIQYVQNSGVVYNQTKVFNDGTWAPFPDAIRQPCAYTTNQDIPLDMSPTSSRAMRMGDIYTPSSSTSRSIKNSKRESVKRSLNRCRQAYNTDSITPVAKAARGRSCYSSTNVHTLKPRHFVSWYIDHLIQENEDITNISRSNTWQEVSIFQSKDLYFMEPLLKRSGFPSSKFLTWMEGNFPSINIHAIDFTEGRQRRCLTNFEAELDCKSQSEIINDTFLYFQGIQSGKN